MNAETPTPDLSECAHFLRFWMETTGTSHITLVGIIPDGDATARTFALGDDATVAWIAARQQVGCGIYFQPNETKPGFAKKPAKTDMVTGLCRFADIDPVDDQFPYADEQLRLARLAEFLAADPDFAPTVVIHSGNGIQPLWAVRREALTPEVIARIEAETKTIETHLGAGGTHNIDRLLRLPGTINYPNRKKLGRGRGVSRARLIHAAANMLTAAQAAALGAHLGTVLCVSDLVRPARQKPGAETGSNGNSRDKGVAALMKALNEAAVDKIAQVGDLPAALRERLEAALKARPRLADRWDGLVDDLTERGLDGSRSGADLSLAAMLKAAGFSHLETGLILCAFQHGKVSGDNWPNLDAGLRYVARCVLRSYGPAAQGGDGLDDAVAAMVAEFNKHFMVVSEAGKAMIYEPAFDRILQRKFNVRITFEDFRKLHLNRHIQIGKKVLKAADVWLESTGRRDFLGGVVFDPSRSCATNALNLWDGFAVEPKAGSWDLLKSHILSVICGGNESYYNYLISWMARLVQFPAQQGEVAVVLRGGEGTGKGTLARALLHILGQHGLIISNAKHLTGNFNAHLRDCIFLFADEAFFAGDKQHVGVLKSIITEDRLTIEAKYANAQQFPNYIHLLMASNEEWVVPASLDSRRFFCLEVLPVRANHHAYFGLIWREMEAGGFAAMLRDLLDHDLTNFNVRCVPVTEGLHVQRALSLGVPESWWLDVLYRGFVWQSKLGLEAWFGDWHETVSTSLLYDSYSCHAQRKHDRHPLHREAFGKFMVSMGCQRTQPGSLTTGEHMTDVKTIYGSSRQAARIEKTRAMGYKIGTLAEAREAFVKKTGLATVWPEEGEP